MENKNEIKNLNEKEVNEISGGYNPFNQEKGRWVDSVCYKCNKNFKEYVNPMRNMGKKTGRPSICPECMRKWHEELEQKNPKVLPLKSLEEILKRAEESTNR